MLQLQQNLFCWEKDVQDQQAKNYAAQLGFNLSATDPTLTCQNVLNEPEFHSSPCDDKQSTPCRANNRCLVTFYNHSKGIYIENECTTTS